MTTTRRNALTLALVLTAGPAAALDATLMQRSTATGDPQGRADERLAEARLHAELGGHERALAAYRSLAEDAAQPSRLRGRARLGEAVMQRRLGHDAAWIDPFFEAIAVAHELEDVELAREILEASGALTPVYEDWTEIEPLLAFERRQGEEGREVVVPPEGLQAGGPTATSSGERSIRTALRWAQTEFAGVPISLSMEDAELMDLFRMFQEISGTNIVVDPSLKGSTITMDAQEVPWDQVLAIVMKANGLDSRFEGNVLRIAPKEKLAAEDQERAALQAARELAGEVRSIARTLSHADGQVALERVRRRLSARGTAQLDLRTNTIIVKDLVSRMPEIERLLNGLDQPQSDQRFTGEPVSLSFRAAELPDVLTLLGQLAGLDLAIDRRLAGRTCDLAVSDQPWDAVLHGLLTDHELTMIGVGGVRYVLPRPSDDDEIVEFRGRDGTVRLGRPDAGW